jgi:hypothetical protein
MPVVARRTNTPIDRPPTQQPIRGGTQQRRVITLSHYQPHRPDLLLQDHRRAAPLLRRSAS